MSEFFGCTSIRLRSSIVRGFEFDAYGKAALKFRDEVRGLGYVKRSGGDEQDVICAQHAVFCVDVGAFDDRQQVALNAFAGNIRFPRLKGRRPCLVRQGK